MIHFPYSIRNMIEQKLSETYWNKKIPINTERNDPQVNVYVHLTPVRQQSVQHSKLQGFNNNI